MAVNPEMAANVAKQLLDTYRQAEEQMLAAVARRLARGIETEGWADAKLAEMVALRRQLERIVDRAQDLTPRQIEFAIAKAHGIGVAAAGNDLRTTGRIHGAFTGTAEGTAVRTLAAELQGTLSTIGPHALRAVEDIYQDVIFQATRFVATGTTTRRQAAQSALNAFAGRGITGFVDRAGRNWDMASYTEMAVRSTSGRAAISGHGDKLAEMGLDLVQVSDAPEECRICRPWEGRILSLRGRTPDRPTVAQATSAGLFHPNCRHSIGLYDPRVSTIPKRTADPVGDQQRQQQRYLERKTREWKRREAVALSPQEAEKARGKVQEWQGNLRTFVDANDRKRLRYREQITSAR